VLKCEASKGEIIIQEGKGEALYMVTLSFGEKLMLLRKKKKLSQRELAKKLGLAFTNLPRYEGGEYLPKAEVLLKLSRIFNVSIDYLLMDESQTPEIVNVKDNEFLSLIKEADQLPDAEKNRLKNLLKSYLTDHGK
jgi:transcriptional regulator with XRE-family HTH domain